MSIFIWIYGYVPSQCNLFQGLSLAFKSPFCGGSGKKPWCYYPHRLRDSLPPVCGIFIQGVKQIIVAIFKGAAEKLMPHSQNSFKSWFIMWTFFFVLNDSLTLFVPAAIAFIFKRKSIIQSPHY